MTTVVHRSADEIGRSAFGSRPLPPLDRYRTAPQLSSVDTVLPNGLRGVAVRLASVPMAELRLRIPLAGAHPGHRAFAELLAAGLMCGTAKRDRTRIYADLAALGGEVVAEVNPERLLISASGLAETVPALLDVVSEVIRTATYPDALMEPERTRLVQQMNLLRAQPARRAQAELRRHCYGDHPYARQLPSTSELEAAGIGQVRNLHAQAIVPRGSVVVLAGAHEPGHSVRLLADAFAAWDLAGTAGELPPLPPVAGGEVRLAEKAGATQAQIRLCAQAVPRHDPRYPALRLATQILGGSFSSRLMSNLRERRGYTYSVRSSIEFTPGGATVLVETDTANEVTAAALREIWAELDGLVLGPPSPAEIDEARQYLIGTDLLSASSQAGFASAATATAAAGLTLDWLRTQPERLAAVTPAQVADVAREYLSADSFSGVVVGDSELLADVAEVLPSYGC
ncbi:M16 family metallopeptidase [Amycolatopsis lurida]